MAASNYSAARLGEALEIARASCLPRFVAIQALYNAVERDEYERELAPLLSKLNIPGVAYSALAKGFLSGRFSIAALADDDTSPWAQATRRLEPRGAAVLRVIQQIAGTHGVNPPADALARLLSRPTVGAVTAAATSLGQLTEMLPATTLALAESELDAITDALPPRQIAATP